MFRNNNARRIAEISLFCLAFSMTTYSRTPSPAPATQADLNQAGNVVQAFCTFWKTLRFDSIYVLMIEENRTDTAGAPFLNAYNILNDNSGKLISFTVKEAIPNEQGIMVKTQLSFDKIIPPTMINGVHNFHLIKEAGQWKVKVIVPPIVPPEKVGSGGGHPGE